LLKLIIVAPKLQIALFQFCIFAIKIIQSLNSITKSNFDMKKNLINFRTITAVLAFASILSFSSCNSGANADDVEKTKAALNENNSPNTVPGAEQNPTITPTNATNPQTKEVTPESATTMVFDKDVHDFGTVKDGDKVTHVFKFKNSGDKPLTIFDAKGSCGCTVPEYPRAPIAPGESGEIKVEFNSKGKKGLESKFVTLNANTIPGETRLTIKANVIAADVQTK
jgi:hypothetical protein